MTKNIAQNRDMSQFIKGEHIDCRKWAKDSFPVIFSVERIESKTLQNQWSLILKDKSGKMTEY